MASNKLKFSPDRLITGINIVDNMLFFTDNENEPKKINIDSFKAADHSSGTTHIYNREFLQRDITVIRPHPPTSIKTSLTNSEDVNIEAEDPQIITDPNVGTTSSTALLKGSSINGGAFFKKRGFYYLKLDSDTPPSKDTLISQGELKLVGNDGTTFESLITSGLVSGSKYFFLAFGQTNVNEQVTGEIYDFRVATTGGTLDITTDQPTRKETLIATLNGTVKDDGGSNVYSTGFYYKIVSSLDTSTEPTTLHSNEVAISGAEKINAVKKFQKFKIDLPINGAGKKIYVQAWGKNENGEDQGLVESYIMNQASKPTLITNYNGGTSRYKTYAFLCAKVDNPFGTRIKERGFYFSSKTNEFIKLKNESEEGVFKGVDSNLSALNHLEKFSYDTRFQGSPAAVTTGETIYYMPYAINDSDMTGYGPIGEAIYLEESSNPGIKTQTPVIDFLHPDGKACNGRSGCNSIVTIFCEGILPGTESLNVDKVSFYITRTAAGETLGVDQNARRREMQKRISAYTATEIPSDQANGAVGSHTATFSGNNIISAINAGFRYHVCAVATIGEASFLGDVYSAPYNVDTAGVTIRTRSVNPYGTTTATFNGTVTKKLTNAGAIQGAGFVWATSLSDLAAFRETSASNHELISSGDLTTLNAFITAGTGNGNFSFAKTGLTANQKYYVQAFYVQGAHYEYAKADNEGSAYDGEDIYEFQTTAAAVTYPENFNLYIVGSGLKHADSITINAELSSNRNLFNMSPTYYYKKTSEVVGATDALKKSDIRSTGAFGTITISVPMHSSSSASRVSAIIPGLDANTEYSIIVVANNGHTQSVTSGFVAGEFSSNIEKSTTGPALKKPLPSIVTVTDESENGARFSYIMLSDGGTAPNAYTTKSYYYIKASDFSGTTPAQLIADSDAVQVEALPFHFQTGLEPNEDYKVVAVIGNSIGNGVSNTITSFKTLGGAGNVKGENTIFTQDSWLEYSYEGIAHGKRYIEVELSPSNAYYTVKVGQWLGNPYSIPVTFRQNGTNGNGHKVLELNVPRNDTNQMRRCTVTILHSLDPSKVQSIEVYQDANPHHSPQPGLGYGNPFAFGGQHYNPYLNY